MIAVAAWSWGVPLTPPVAAGWMAAAVAVTVALALRARERRLRDAAARASHEVRGPLTAAQLALDGLTLRGEVDAAHTLGLELQLRRAGRALDDLAGAPAGDRLEPVALDALAAGLESAWRPVAAARRRSLVVDVGGVGAVLGDRIRLAQAVGNLLGNALDHGAGAVRLSVTTAGTRARIVVTDDGPGPARALPALLTAPAGTLPRHGHGLRVAASVAAAAGGRLHQSGAAFALELPLLTDVPACRAARGRAATGARRAVGLCDDASARERT